VRGGVKQVCRVTALDIIVGMATVYAGPYVGQPLYCSTPDAPLYYAETTVPWAAFPAKWYRNGIVSCGAVVVFSGVDANGKYWTLTVRALDAGPFGDNCVVVEDKCIDIVADVPAFLSPFAGLSSQVRVWNVTRVCEEWGLCD